jgi:hypothetical protein
LIYKCGGIDKRTIEKFEKVRAQNFFTLDFSHLIAHCPSVGHFLASHNRIFNARTFLLAQQPRQN